MSYDELRNKFKVQLSFYHCKTRKRQIREYSYTREMKTTRLRLAEVEYFNSNTNEYQLTGIV